MNARVQQVLVCAYSDHPVLQVMDKEAMNVVNEADLRTIELMTKYRCTCDHEALIEHE